MVSFDIKRSDWSSVEVRRYTIRRSLKMLQNGWFICKKSGVDTAENEPTKVSRKDRVRVGVPGGIRMQSQNESTKAHM